MAVIDTYAKRRHAREREGEPEVYQYDTVSDFLRRQIAFVFEAGLGPWWSEPMYFTGSAPPHGTALWNALSEGLEREVEGFPTRAEGNSQKRYLRFLLAGEPTDDWLTAVESGCRLLEHLAKGGRSQWNAHQIGATQLADNALEEINIRFREQGFGYEYANRQIIRVDDQFIHAEVVKPALQLLIGLGFEKANEEFMTAHRHLREGHDKDAIVAANRSFESALKAICERRGWGYPKGARASDLVTVVRKNALLPEHLGTGIDTYVSMLKTGLPTIRNNAGGHGAEPSAVSIPDYLPSYVIHLTAANLVLVLNADREMQ